MKRYILAIVLILSTVTIFAQETTQQPDAESRPIKEFLSSFSAIDVDAPIVLSRLPEARFAQSLYVR